ncbi:type II toxin-antitoxin system Phd/YefM family antitoxin [Candidatus Curtissbacteria bacterium]|nr:type II toxin-antitoxin system Phd/YefM family antitoxin [Candidatus Curtissbacteria bacterium]
MFNTNIIPARNLQKSYKSIIERVKTKKNAIVLTTNKKPQAAIVSLEDLDRIQQAKAMQSSLDILKLATESKEELKNLPADLRKRANKILYSIK